MLEISGRFNGSAAYLSADFHHFAYLERVGDDPCVAYTADILEVGNRASKYASALIRHRRFSNQDREDAICAGYAGVFIYAMERYGLSFTDVARLTCPTVARILRAITPDPREDEGRRYQLLCSQLSTAPSLALAVRAAELKSTARKLIEHASPQWTRRNQVELRAWVGNSARLVDAMGPRFYSKKRFANQLAGITRDINVLHARIGQLRRRNVVRAQAGPPPAFATHPPAGPAGLMIGAQA